MDCGGNVQTGGICLLGYQFCPFYDFSIGFLGKIVEKSKIDTLRNNYHPV
jgi:hypothetical protein